MEAIKDADAPPAAAPAPAEGEERPRARCGRAPAKNGAVVMAEALYQATEDARLVPKHLAQNRPVVLCGGIRHHEPGQARPLCKNLGALAARAGQPNDAFSSYRASLRAAVRPGSLVLLGAVVFEAGGSVWSVASVLQAASSALSNQSFLTVTLRISRERQRTASSSTCERAGDQCLLASPT